MTEDSNEAERIARIEAETEAAARAENDALLVGMAPYVLMGAFFIVFLLSPLITIAVGSFPFSQTIWKGMGWLWIDIPLVVFAAIVFRRGRFKMRDGRVYEGWIVRAAAVLAILMSFVAFWIRTWSWG